MNALTSARWLKSWKHCYPGALSLALAGGFLLAAQSALSQTNVTSLTDANHGQPGYRDGNTFSLAQFRFPAGIALDPSGTRLFLADYTNNAIRLVSDLGNKSTSLTSTVYTNKDGINHPIAVIVDAATNIYVLNYGSGLNGSLVQFNGANYLYNSTKTIISTNAAQLTNAVAMTIDGLNNLYLAINSNTVIRVSPQKAITVVGVITNAGTELRGLACLSSGKIALTDSGNNGIWLLDPWNLGISNNVVKFTGFHGAKDTNGAASVAAFNHPENIVRAGNDVLVVADRMNHKVKVVDANGTVARLFGVKSSYWGLVSGLLTPGWNDGAVNPNEAADTVQSRQPYGLAIGADGNIYDTEVYYHILRKVTGTGLVGPGPLPTFYGSTGIAVDSSVNNLAIPDPTNNTIRLLNLANNQTTDFLNNSDGISSPASVLYDPNNNLYVLNQNAGTNGNIISFDAFGNLLATNATGLNAPTAFTRDANGNLFVAEQSGNVRVVFPSGIINTLVTVTNVGVSLQGIALFDDGNIVVSDAGNHVLWTINPLTKVIAKLTGQLAVSGTTLGASNVAKLFLPHQLARAGGDTLVIADTGNNRLVTVNRSGAITNILNSANATLWFGQNGDPVASGNYRFVPMISPAGVAVAVSGKVFTSETYYNDIRGLNLTLPAPAADPIVTLPYFNYPAGLAADTSGVNLYIADYTNNAVQQLNLLNNQTTTYLTTANGVFHPAAVLLDPSNNLYVLNQNAGTNGNIISFDAFGNLLATNATGLNSPTAFTQDANGNLFVAEQSGNVRVVFPSGIINTLVTVTNTGVSLQGIALFNDGNIVVSDAGNHVLWTINPLTKVVNRLTGQLAVSGATLGSSNFARLFLPHHLARAGGDTLIIADTGNNRLVTVDRFGSITNVLNSTNASVWFGQNGDPIPAGNNKFVAMISPVGVAVTAAGKVFTSETYYNDIRGLNLGVTAPPFIPIVTLPYFNYPAGLAADVSGVNLYLADYTNNAVQRLNLLNNQTTTYLTTANGVAHPISVLLDPNNHLYVLNQNAGPNGNIISFDAFGNLLATNATGLNQPTAFTQDANGNLFVAEQAGSIRIVFPSGATNTLTTITNAGVSLQGIALFDDGNIAVSDAGNQVIWTVNPLTKVITKLTGQLAVSGTTLGASNVAKLFLPHHLARAGGDTLVIADTGNNRLVTVDRFGSITNILNATNASVWFGQNGDPVPSGNSKFVQMVSPVGVAVTAAGKVFTSETYYNDIRGLNAALPAPATTPIVTLPFFNYPAGIAADISGVNLYIADYTNNAVQQLNLLNNQTVTYLTITNGVFHPADVLLDPNNNLYVLNQNAGTNGNIISFDPYGCNCPLGTNATGLNQPTAFTMDGNGNIFVSEQAGSIRMIFPSGVTNTLVTITNAGVSLQGIALFDDGNIAVSDAGNHVIWTVNPLTKAVTLLTGQLGTNGTTLGAANCALLFKPHHLARAGGDTLVIADTGNNRLVTVDRFGSITNVLNSTNASVWFGQNGDPIPAGNNKFVAMISPVGVAVTAAGKVFTSETYYNDIRGLNLGVTAPLFIPIVTLPYFNNQSGIAFDSVGNLLFIADTANNTVQELNLANNQTTVFLSSLDGIVQPASVLLDTNENVYVLDQNAGTNGTVLAFDIFGNFYGPVVTGLNQPTAFTLDGYGKLVIAEQSGNIKIFGGGTSNIVATITNAGVSLQGIALFDDGNIAVSDAGNHVIWTVNPITKAITKLTGQLGVSGATLGASNFAKLNRPHQLSRAGNNSLVIADNGNNRLVTVTRTGSIVYTLNSTNAMVWFGQNGDPVLNTSPKFIKMVSPSGVAVGNGGEVFTSETFYSDIRGILGSSVSYPSFNPGVPLPAYSGASGIALNSTFSTLFIADPTNNTVSALNLANNQTTVFLTVSNGIYQPVDVAVDSSDYVYVLNQGTATNGSIRKFDKYGNLVGTNAASLSLPTAMKLNFSGDFYVSELNGAVKKFYAGGSNAILAVITTNASVRLQGIAVLDNGSVVVSDAGNHVLWQINSPNTNAVLFTGVIGSPGANFGSAGSALLNTPQRLAQAYGGLLLIADSGNNRVVVADDLGTVSSALNSANATLWFGLPIDPVSTNSPNYVSMLSPVGLAIGSGGTVFASESVYKDIRGLLNTGIQSPIPPPPAPLNLVATASYGQVSLTWSAATGATNYIVKRSTSTGGPYTVIGNNSAIGYTDNGVLNGSTYYYVVSAANGGGESANSAEASAHVPLPPVADPQIGYVDFPPTLGSVFHPAASFIFNNDTPIVIQAAAGSQAYYTYGATSTNAIPDPTTNSASAPVGYYDHMSPSQVAIYSVNPQLPDVTIKALGAKSDGSPNSAVVQARFQFITANPNITGDNAGQFFISDVTANAHLYYTLDGTDPSVTNGVDLGTVATPTNLWTVGFPITTNTLFKVRAVRTHFQDSGIVSVNFSPSNFVANVISFGFANGEASSDFVAAPGQMFYAPVTLTLLSSATLYSLQFNLTVTNLGAIPVAPGAYDFSSMLVKPIPGVTPIIYETIPPAMFVSSNGLNPNPVYLDGSTNFQSMLFTNSSLNLLGVGWIERSGFTNLYDTTKQDLTAFSMAHDTLFTEAGGKVIVGGYAFQVPPTATGGDSYKIQIGRPSATSDGVGGAGSDLYIAAPTNGATAGGPPVNALKYVTVGVRKYLAGSVYPFRWFNAGDFGSSNLVSADVMQVFQSAVYGLNTPPANTDFYDSMDSCGATYIDLGHGYLEFDSYISGPSALVPLFDGNDSSINQIAFGDGVLDVCDVYVTFRRSLDPSLTWFRRFWNNGQRVADTNAPNIASHLASKAVSSGGTIKSQAASSIPPQVNFAAGDIQGAAGQVVQIPINATIFGSYPLRVLMLNLTVEPLDGSPALTIPVQFNQIAPLGSPYTAVSRGNGNFSAVWLNRTNSGLTGTVTLGTLSVTIPAGAGTNAAYAVHFDHASASPNGLASFPKQTLTGLITLSSRTNSSFGDGIPDSWRLRWFGTVNNYLSLSNACPSGDGVNNYQKFVAGVDPNTANDFPSLNSKNPKPSEYMAIHWPTVSGKNYVIERSTTLFSGAWTAIATNTGTGSDLEFDDPTTGSAKFYRVRILP